MKEEKDRAKREIDLIEKWGEDEGLKIEGAGRWEDLLVQEEEDKIGYYKSLMALQALGGWDGPGQRRPAVATCNGMIAPRPVIALQLLDPRVAQIMARRVTQTKEQGHR